MAPFYVTTANGRLYSSFDAAQQLTAALADCGAQCIHSGRSGKGEDRLKIVPVKMTFRLKAAAFENSIGDADCGGRFKLELLSGFIIIHQERAVNDGADVPAVVVPVIRHQFPGNIGKLLAYTLSADAIGLVQHFRNRLFQVIVVLPHLRITGIAAHPGVRHIENVVQAGKSAGFV